MAKRRSSPHSEDAAGGAAGEQPDDCDAHVAWAVSQWPEIDPDTESIVNRVETVGRYLDRAAVESREAVGLSHGDLKVLLRLSRGRRSHGDIARELLISTGTMTNRLDKLEAAGLLSRHPDPADRRGVLVELTAEGRTTLDRYIELQAGREKRLLAGISPEEKRQLSDLLRRVVASFASEPGLVKR